jgi:hypothetical protein
MNSPIVTVKCSTWNEEVTLEVKNHVAAILDNAIELEIISPFLREVIVTDSYKEEFQAISKKWEIHSFLSHEAEYLSIGRVCFNKNPEDTQFILLLHSAIFNSENQIDLIHELLLNIYAFGFLPKELQYPKPYHFNTPIAEIAINFFPTLFESVYAKIRLSDRNLSDQIPPLSPKQILAPFKRKVKRLHLQHQSDSNFEYCVIHYYNAVARLLDRIVELSFYKIDYSEFNEFERIFVHFIDELYKQSLNIINKEPYSIEFLKNTLIDISAICFFKITEIPYDIKVADSPKKLFPDLIDTHHRIVAFIDVLGFSNMIRHFDKNDDVRLLIDLKDSLDTAILQLNTYFKASSEDVEFKLFSDCLCLSIPYFDNDTDFAYQFASIMLGVKTYQFLMLQKGYLVRGGIAIGSYYSDNNMIFSGALVEAVEYEKSGSTHQEVSKTKPPRILVSPVILEKLPQTRIHRAIHNYFYDGLVIDEDGEIFVNPLFDLGINEKVFSQAFEEIDFADTELSEVFSPLVNISKQLISSFSTPNQNELLLETVASKIDEKITQYQGQSFVQKYLWVKELIQWIKENKQTNRFKVYKPEFKEIVDSWTDDNEK